LLPISASSTVWTRLNRGSRPSAHYTLPTRLDREGAMTRGKDPSIIMIASSSNPSSGLMAANATSPALVGLDPQWLAALAQLPVGATLPMPKDWYDPHRATLLIKQGHPVDQAMMARLIRFVQPQTLAPSGEFANRHQSSGMANRTAQTSRMSLPQVLTGTYQSSTQFALSAQDIVLVVEPDKVTCRKVLSQLSEANISSGRIRTIPALSWLERSLRQLNPGVLILGWAMSDPQQCETLWGLLKRLRRQYPRLQVVVLGGVAPADRDEIVTWQQRASHTQANFLTKPLQATSLSSIIR
jgi:hypothetical protein